MGARRVRIASKCPCRDQFQGFQSGRTLASPAFGSCSSLRNSRAESHSEVQRIPRSHSSQSRQKSLKRVGLSAVYRVVCVIDACPSQSWIALVSMPSFASL
jgi:hypothetical protein